MLDSLDNSVAVDCDVIEVWKGQIGKDSNKETLGRITVVIGVGVFIEKSTSVNRQDDPSWSDVEPDDQAWRQCMIHFAYQVAKSRTLT